MFVGEGKKITLHISTQNFFKSCVNISVYTPSFSPAAAVSSLRYFFLFLGFRNLPGSAATAMPPSRLRCR